MPFALLAQKNMAPFTGNPITTQFTTKADMAVQQKMHFDMAAPATSVAKHYARLEELQHPMSELRLVSTVNSPVGMHLFYQQYFNGTPVHGAYLKVNVGTNGEQLSAYNHLYPSAGWQAQTFTQAPEGAAPIYIVNEGMLVPAFLTHRDGMETVTRTDGTGLMERDLKLGYSNDDTMVKAMVFLPDPLSSQQVVYGKDGSYQHFNDSDYARLNDQRAEVYFPATLRNDTFYQENEYSILLDIVAPNIAPGSSHTPEFSFTRKADGFKEAMAMFHIYNTQKYIQSIGFNNIAHYKLRVDAHAGYTDNSFFKYTPDTSLVFGIGGVPDAEDADIIVHEYTHAISHSINPSGIVSTERRAIEEGICDVMASTASRVYTSFNWRSLFNFDAPNPITPGVAGFWSGRNSNSPKTYANKVDDYYSDCEIWSSTINDIVEDLGRDTVMKLLLTSLYSYTPNTTMPEAAQLFMQADSLVYNKYNTWKLGKYFNRRLLGNFPTGIEDAASAPTFTVMNTAGFADGSGDAVITLERPATITVYNLQGRKVYEATSQAGNMHLSPAAFVPGFYIMTVENDKGLHTIKLNRF